LRGLYQQADWDASQFVAGGLESLTTRFANGEAVI
jgi:hypothetical protein